MSDRLYQNLIGTPVSELTEDIVVDMIAADISATVRALGRAAESRVFPVELDWLGLRVDVRPSILPGSNGRLHITASAPVK